jgi:hypothetical protein
MSKNEKKEEHRRRGSQRFSKGRLWLWDCARKRATLAGPAAMGLSHSARNIGERCESFRQQRGCVCAVFSCLFYFSLSHRNTHTHIHSVALITPPPSQLARPTPLLAFVRQPPLSFWPSRLRHPHHLPSSITQGRQLTYALLSRVW